MYDHKEYVAIQHEMKEMTTMRVSFELLIISVAKVGDAMPRSPG